MLTVFPFGTAIAQTTTVGGASFNLISRDRSTHQLLNGTTQIATGPDPAPLLQRLARELMLHIGVNTPEFVFLHAGVVGWRDRAILFPGSSCAGKTTLVVELLKLGATYYSDDYALLDSNGMVHPYASDLQVRQPGRMEQTRLRLDELGGRPPTAPAPVAQVVFTQFTRGATWSPDPLTPGQAVLEMLRHTIAAQRRPAEVMQTLSTMMLTANACRSQRGEARIMAKSLLSGCEW